MKLAELVEKRARAAVALRAANDAGDNAKFDQIDAEIVAIDAEIDRTKKVEAYEKTQAAFGETKQPPMPDIKAGDVDPKTGVVLSPRAKLARDPAYAKVFSKYLRNDVRGLNAEEQKMIYAAQTETTTGGGYLIPTGFSGQLEEALLWFGGILDACYSFETETGNPLPWPTVNDTANEGEILGVNTQLNEQDFAFNQVVFGAFTHNSKSVLVPIQLLQDSYFNLDKKVAEMLGTRLGRGMNHKLTTGVGTTEPSGVVTEVLNSGNIYVTANGQTSTIIGDDLINLEHLVDPAYRPKGKYMFADSTLKAIKKLKDSYGRYLWLPGLAVNDPNTINGYPYVINQHMQGLGLSDSPPVHGNRFALFGDFSKYAVRRVAGEITVMVLKERYADYLQVGYQAFVRYDGKLLDAGTHPIAVACQATS